MTRRGLRGIILGMLPCSALLASDARAERPRILGISHVALRVSGIARSRSFFLEFLGYTALSPASAQDGSTGLLIAVNDRQYIELRPGLEPSQDRLAHLALETDDIEAMRRYLAARGVAVPLRTTRDVSGNRAFVVSDPEQRALELLQHAPGGWPKRVAAPGEGTTAVSRRMLHAGILVGDLPAANRFYAELLGLAEIWRGSRSGTELSWTNMKVPNGPDYVEFMLYGEPPEPAARGSQHHICLEVADIEKARTILLGRPYATSYGRPLEIRVGINRKRQLNLYDPDGTRVELSRPRSTASRCLPRRPRPRGASPSSRSV